MSDDVPVIAVDGPVGAGKGAVCFLVAARLGFHLLDSGAIYRVLALASLRRGLEPGDSGPLWRGSRPGSTCTSSAANAAIRYG